MIMDPLAAKTHPMPVEKEFANLGGELAGLPANLVGYRVCWDHGDDGPEAHAVVLTDDGQGMLTVDATGYYDGDVPSIELRREDITGWFTTEEQDAEAVAPVAEEP